MNSYYENQWKYDKGTDYFQNFRWTPVFQRQEQEFRNYIKDLFPQSVLELGVGFGRMTKIMLEEIPTINKYVGVDISPQQIDNARLFLGGYDEKKVQFVEANVLEYSDTNNYDLILASEILLHIRPNEDIHRLMQKMKVWAQKDIIHVDWAREYQESNWCFIHPYYNLFSEIGFELVKEVQTDLQSIWHWRKKNI